MQTQTQTNQQEQKDTTPTSTHPFIDNSKRRSFVHTFENNEITVNVMAIGSVLHFSITETGGFAAHILAESSTLHDITSFNLKTLLGHPDMASTSLVRRLVEVIGLGRSVLVAITLRKRDEAVQMKLAKDLYSRQLDECLGI